MSNEAKVLKAFKCAIKKVDKEKCIIYDNREKILGIKFDLENIHYKAEIHKYKLVKIKNIEYSSFFSDFRNDKILSPCITISIWDGRDGFVLSHIEDADFIKEYKKFFEDVLEAIKNKKEQKEEQFLNKIIDC